MPEEVLKPTVSAEEAREIYTDWRRISDERMPWIRAKLRGEQFYYGRQWSDEERIILSQRGQTDYVQNRIFPAVQSLVASTISKTPSFLFASHSSQDVSFLNSLLYYIFSISNFRKVGKKVIESALVKGAGYFYIWEDKESSFGLGDVIISFINVRDVYVPRCTKMWDLTDAPYIYWSRLCSVGTLIDDYGISKDKAEKLACIYDETYLDDVNAVGDTESNEFFEGAEDSTIDRDDGQTQYVRLVKRFKRVKRKIINFYNIRDGKSIIYPDGHTFSAEEKELISSGTFTALRTKRELIEVVTIAGADGRIVEQPYYLDIGIAGKCYYPVVPLYYVDTESPFPKSAVEFLEGQQKLVNKACAMVLQNAQLGSNMRLLGPTGAFGRDQVEREEFEANFAVPGSVNEYNPDPATGAGITIVTPLPLNNAFFSIEQEAKREIQYVSGRFEMDMGGTSDAPQTKGATLAIHEWGQDRLRLFLEEIEDCLDRVGKVTYALCLPVYVSKRQLNYVNSIGKADSLEINVSENGKISNSVIDTRASVAIKPSSFAPTYRYIVLELLMNMMKMGMPVGDLVVKYIDLPDEEKKIVEERLAQQFDIEKLKQAIDEVSKKNANLEAENLSLRKGIEVEKTKGKLDTATAVASQEMKSIVKSREQKQKQEE